MAKPFRKSLYGILLAGLLGGGGWLVFEYWEGQREHRFDPLILEASTRYGLDPALIKAVIWQESGFRPEVVGKAGEIGLMQVTEDAAIEWADAERLTNFAHRIIFDPRQNIRAGSFYLSKVLKRYARADNPLPYALADYNAGRGRVLQWNKGAAETNSAAFLEQMTFPGTRRYAEAIMHRHEHYKGQFATVQTRPKS